VQGGTARTLLKIYRVCILRGNCMRAGTHSGSCVTQRCTVPAQGAATNVVHDRGTCFVDACSCRLSLAFGRIARRFDYTFELCSTQFRGLGGRNRTTAIEFRSQPNGMGDRLTTDSLLPHSITIVLYTPWPTRRRDKLTVMSTVVDHDAVGEDNTLTFITWQHK